MSTTGEQFGASATTSAHSSWVDEAFINPTLVSANDGNAAGISANTFDNNTYTQILKVKDFGFDLSTVDTIDNIIVRWEAWTEGGSVVANFAKLIDAGEALTGTNVDTLSTLLGAGTVIVSVDGSAGEWGVGLSSGLVNQAGFGVGIGAISYTPNNALHVDYVTLEIIYTTAGAESNAINVKFVEC